MKISFDGLRRRIAEDYNSLIDQTDSSHFGTTADRNAVEGKISALRASLQALMSCYDPDQAPDFTDLSEIELKEP